MSNLLDPELRDPEGWSAFGLTIVFLLFWGSTPLGQSVCDTIRWFGALLKNTPLAEVGKPLSSGEGDLFAWPIAGMSFFYGARDLLKRRRLK